VAGDAPAHKLSERGLSEPSGVDLVEQPLIKNEQMTRGNNDLLRRPRSLVSMEPASLLHSHLGMMRAGGAREELRLIIEVDPTAKHDIPVESGRVEVPVPLLPRCAGPRRSETHAIEQLLHELAIPDEIPEEANDGVSEKDSNVSNKGVVEGCRVPKGTKTPHDMIRILLPKHPSVHRPHGIIGMSQELGEGGHRTDKSLPKNPNHMGIHDRNDHITIRSQPPGMIHHPAQMNKSL